MFSVTFITYFFILLSKEQGMIIASPNRFLLAETIWWAISSSSSYHLISDTKFNWWLVISVTPQALIQRLVRFNVFINGLHDGVACTLSKITDDSELCWEWSIEWRTRLPLRQTLSGWKNGLTETSCRSTKANVKSSIPDEQVEHVWEARHGSKDSHLHLGLSWLDQSYWRTQFFISPWYLWDCIWTTMSSFCLPSTRIV